MFPGNLSKAVAKSNVGPSDPIPYSLDPQQID